jgi:hypothetical protein
MMTRLALVATAVLFCGSVHAQTGTSISPSPPLGMTSPLGSTEMGGGGLGPPSVTLTPDPSAPLMTLTPLPGTTPSNPSVTLPTPQSASPCPTTQSGLPTISGDPTTFGAPLTGSALGLATTSCR